MTEPELRQLLERYSRLEISAVDARRRLGDATYGELLRLMAERGIALPVAPTAGREASLEQARAWLFPAGDDLP